MVEVPDKLRTSTDLLHRIAEVLQYAPRPEGMVESHLTGSILVEGVVPGDIDIVYLFETEKDVHNFVKPFAEPYLKNGGDENYMSHFIAVRHGTYNYICTTHEEFYYRNKAVAAVIQLLQLKDKNHRIALCNCGRETDVTTMMPRSDAMADILKGLDDG